MSTCSLFTEFEKNYDSHVSSVLKRNFKRERKMIYHLSLAAEKELTQVLDFDSHRLLYPRREASYNLNQGFNIHSDNESTLQGLEIHGQDPAKLVKIYQNLHTGSKSIPSLYETNLFSHENKATTAECQNCQEPVPQTETGAFFASSTPQQLFFNQDSPSESSSGLEKKFSGVVEQVRQHQISECANCSVTSKPPFNWTKVTYLIEFVRYLLQTETSFVQQSLAKPTLVDEEESGSNGLSLSGLTLEASGSNPGTQNEELATPDIFLNRAEFAGEFELLPKEKEYLKKEIKTLVERRRQRSFIEKYQAVALSFCKSCLLFNCFLHPSPFRRPANQGDQKEAKDGVSVKVEGELPFIKTQSQDFEMESPPKSELGWLIGEVFDAIRRPPPPLPHPLLKHEIKLVNDQFLTSQDIQELRSRNKQFAEVVRLQKLVKKEAEFLQSSKFGECTLPKMTKKQIQALCPESQKLEDLKLSEKELETLQFLVGMFKNFSNCCFYRLLLQLVFGSETQVGCLEVKRFFKCKQKIDARDCLNPRFLELDVLNYGDQKDDLMVDRQKTCPSRGSEHRAVETEQFCNHPGQECSMENCWCVKNFEDCSFDCFCYRYCYNVYKGCNCKGSCQKGCRCAKAPRECQPGVCLCSDPSRLADKKKKVMESHTPGKSPRQGLATCPNQRLLQMYKEPPKVYPAQSSICPSFGLFAGQDFTQGQYICEYLGELVSEEEGERRGQISGLLKSNYLYNLNLLNDLDARLIGSWMKLVNNSFLNMANCKSQYFTSWDGRSIKVVLVASRDIKRGEELFFNYGYSDKKKESIDWMTLFNERFLFDGWSYTVAAPVEHEVKKEKRR